MKLKKLPIIVFLLNIPIALAAEKSVQSTGQSIMNTMYRIFGWFLLDVKANLSEQVYIFYMRFIIWILVFAILYYGVSKVFKDNKNIRLTIAFVLALMTTILIPDALVTQIITTYSMLGAGFVVAIPVAALLLVNHYVFKGENRGMYAVKAILFYLLAVILYNSRGIVEHFPTMVDVDAWIGFAEGICFIAMLYYIWKAIFGGSDSEITPASTGNPISDTLNNLTGGDTPPTPTTPDARHLRNYFNVINQHLTAYDANLRWLKGYGNQILNINAVPNLVPVGLWNQFHTALTHLDDERTHIETQFNHLMSHADFPHLMAGDQRSVVQLMDRWTQYAISETEYTIDFNARFAAGVGP